MVIPTFNYDKLHFIYGRKINCANMNKNFIKFARNSVRVSQLVFTGCSSVEDIIYYILSDRFYRMGVISFVPSRTAVNTVVKYLESATGTQPFRLLELEVESMLANSRNYIKNSTYIG